MIDERDNELFKEINLNIQNNRERYIEELGDRNGKKQGWRRMRQRYCKGWGEKSKQKE